MPWAEQLPSGRWRASYRDRAGKIRSAGSFTHKRAAEKEATLAEHAARQIGWRDPSAAAVSWSEWADAWWQTRSVPASTLTRDLSPLERHLRPRWGSVALADITRHDVRAWCATLSRSGLSTASVRRYLSILSASLTAAVEAQILPANPAIGLKLAPPARGAERFLTEAEFAAIADQLDGLDRSIALFLVGTGARWGEMAGLHRHRVDETRGMVALAETLDGVARVMKPYPKGKEQREVPLLDWVAEALPEPTGERTCGVPHVEGRCRSGLVFTPPRGLLNVANWTKRIWTPAVKSAGLDHVRVHDLRHTYASWLLQRGVALAEVGRLLGHKSWTTTERYAHLAATPRSLVVNALRAPRRGADVEQTGPHDARITSIRPDAI